MKIAEYERLRRWFEEFADSYMGHDPALDDAVQLKRAHTQRVEAEAELLIGELKLGGRAGVLGLAGARLHDVGRFDQFARFRTFDDARSVDHAALGWEILREGMHLEFMQPADRDILLDAVRFHSGLRLPAMDPLPLQTCRIVRDADKLDIWSMVTADYRRFKTAPDTPFYRGLAREAGVSQAVRDDVAAARPVSFAGVKKLNDYVVLQAAMVFDVNYAPTFRQIQERQILPAIRSVLPANDSSVDEMFASIARHVARMAGHLT